jgi:SAM-dependent methyltransferase
MTTRQLSAGEGEARVRTDGGQAPVCVDGGQARVRTLADLLARDEDIDRAVCGVSLATFAPTQAADSGAHDAAPTPYCVLEELFSQLSFDAGSHLLDVGCSTGRVLAFFVRAGLLGRASGVELDAQLAEAARAWTARHPQLQVHCGSVLDLDLSVYTHFYLFNPFDADTLDRFIAAVERQARRPCVVIHMSDNGDTWHYEGRPGWRELASGRIQHYSPQPGARIKLFDYPQHYTIWHYAKDDSEPK